MHYPKKIPTSSEIKALVKEGKEYILEDTDGRLYGTALIDQDMRALLIDGGDVAVNDGGDVYWMLLPRAKKAGLRSLKKGEPRDVLIGEKLEFPFLYDRVSLHEFRTKKKVGDYVVTMIVSKPRTTSVVLLVVLTPM